MSLEEDRGRMCSQTLSSSHRLLLSSQPNLRFNNPLLLSAIVRTPPLLSKSTTKPNCLYRRWYHPFSVIEPNQIFWVSQYDMTGFKKQYPKEAGEHRRIIDQPYGESLNEIYDYGPRNLNRYWRVVKEMKNENEKLFFKIGLACNKKMDRITFCKKKCNCKRLPPHRTRALGSSGCLVDTMLKMTQHTGEWLLTAT